MRTRYRIDDQSVRLEAASESQRILLELSTGLKTGHLRSRAGAISVARGQAASASSAEAGRTGARAAAATAAMGRRHAFKLDK